MGAYLFLCCLIVLSASLGKIMTKKWDLIPFFALVLLFGLRNKVGIDDVTYEYVFSLFQRTPFAHEISYIIEYSYGIISSIVATLGLNHQAVFMSYAVVSYLALYKIVKKYLTTDSEKYIYLLGYIALCMFTTITLMRQFAAAAFFVLYLLEYSEKNIKRSLTYLALAVFFHYAALYLAPLVFLFSPRLRVSNQVKIITPLIALIIGVSGVAQTLIHLLGSYIIPKYQGYIGQTTDSDVGMLHIALLFAYEVQFVFCRKKETHRTDMFQRGQMLYLVLYLTTVGLGHVNRMSLYFYLFAPMVFTNLYHVMKHKKDKMISLVLISIVLLLLFLYQVLIYLDSQVSLVPYSFSIDFIN